MHGPKESRKQTALSFLRACNIQTHSDISLSTLPCLYREEINVQSDMVYEKNPLWAAVQDVTALHGLSLRQAQVQLDLDIKFQVWEWNPLNLGPSRFLHVTGRRGRKLCLSSCAEQAKCERLDRDPFEKCTLNTADWPTVTWGRLLDPQQNLR